jgi:glycosyltransferase involved in cell wall biosynthesis
MRVLHVFFRSVLEPRERFLGTTKDVRGHSQYLRDRQIEREELIIEAREERCLRAGLVGIDLARLDALLIEGTYYPSAVRSLKRQHPNLRILMRGINAELFHWMHSAYAALFHDTPRRVLFDLYSAARFGLKDLLCAWRADAVLPISGWETEHYWRRLAPAARVVTVPYFVPDSYLEDIPAGRARRPECVCMMTTVAGRPFLTDAARNLSRLVAELGKGDPGWTFSITGDFRFDRVRLPSRLEVRGLLENPLELLAGSRAVALLSDYGFGFKTKLLEAICCGCRALVTRKLHERLPEQVKPWCLVVDVRSLPSFREALARCLEPPPAGDPNAALRAEAYAGLDAALGLGPAAGAPAGAASGAAAPPPA